MLTWKELQKQMKAEFVGGDLIFREGRVQKSLGKKQGTKFDFSPLGLKLASTLARDEPTTSAPPQPTTPPRPNRRTRRARKAVANGQD